MAGGYPGGGSRVLGELVDEHGSEVVADLQRHFQVDLGKTITGEGYSPRRVLVFVRNMPVGSKTYAALSEDQRSEGWDTQTYLTAALVDAVRENTFVTAQVQTKKKLKRPEPMDVPGRKTKKPKAKTNMFAQMAAQHMAAAGKE